MSATIMPYWFSCFLDVVLYNISLSLCDFVWLLIVTVWKNGSQPAFVMIAGATSWKTCSACPKGTYQPIEAATRTASSEGCLLCFAVLFVLTFEWDLNISENSSQSPSQLSTQAAEEALCIPCAVGNYSNKIGQAACRFCPKGRHRKNCLSGCIGFHRVPWWRTDINGCWCALMENKCKRIPWLAAFFDSTGYYGDAFGLTACRACPEGTSTKQDGAIRPGLCNASLVPLGSEDVSISNSSFFQCVPVPFWYCSSS